MLEVVCCYATPTLYQAGARLQVCSPTLSTQIFHKGCHSRFQFTSIFVRKLYSILNVLTKYSEMGYYVFFLRLMTKWNQFTTKYLGMSYLYFPFILGLCRDTIIPWYSMYRASESKSLIHINQGVTKRCRLY